MRRHGGCSHACPVMSATDPITVLVVDDEPAVRRLLQTGLTRHGLRVLAAKDGPTAVQLYRQGDARVDVVLSDVRMPDLDGPHAVDALREIDPNVRTAFMSGDTGYYSAADLARHGATLLRKPFANLPALAGVLPQVAGRTRQARCVPALRGVGSTTLTLSRQHRLVTWTGPERRGWRAPTSC